MTPPVGRSWRTGRVPAPAGEGVPALAAARVTEPHDLLPQRDYADRVALRRLVADLGYPYLAVRLSTAAPYPAGAGHAPRLPADQIIDRVPG